MRPSAPIHRKIKSGSAPARRWGAIGPHANLRPVCGSRPIVSEEPGHGHIQGSCKQVGLIGVHGSFAILDAPDGVSGEAGQLGKARLPKIPPQSQTAQTASDLQAEAHKPWVDVGHS